MANSYACYYWFNSIYKYSFISGQVLKGDLKSAIEIHEMLYQVTLRHNFLPEVHLPGCFVVIIGLNFCSVVVFAECWFSWTQVLKYKISLLTL